MVKQIKIHKLEKDVCKFCGFDYCKKNLKSHEKLCEKLPPEARGATARKGGRGKIHPLHPKHQCSKCYENFTNIRRHEKLCQPKIKEECPIFCGAKVLIQNLLDHLKRCKNKEKVSICHLCFKLFVSSKREEELLNHFRQFHPHFVKENNEHVNENEENVSVNENEENVNENEENVDENVSEENVNENIENVKENNKYVKENDQKVVSKRSFENPCASVNKKLKSVKFTQVFKSYVTNQNAPIYKNCTIGADVEKVEKMQQNLDALNKVCEMEKCDFCLKIYKKSDTDHICED